MAKNTNFYPVILAGGRGTRFWPLSRKKRAKQLLALDGKQTMIQQTVARLLPLASPKQFWIITNDDLRPAILKQLPSLPKPQVLAEPVGRNTAPAIGLAAFLLLREHPDAVIGMFPSDHVIGDEKRYRTTIERGLEIAAAGENIVVLGIRPTRAETGYGYIEAGSAFDGDALRVRRFTEKPDAERPPLSSPAGNYFWNSGMFLWSARTLANALREHLPKTAPCWKRLPPLSARANLRRPFASCIPGARTSASIMPCSSRVRRRASRPETSFACLPISAGTIWAPGPRCTSITRQRAVHLTGNLIHGAGAFVLNAQGNYVHAPGKFVAAVGVSDFVVVETADALLITTRQHAQDVGKVVKYLDEKKLHKLV